MRKKKKNIGNYTVGNNPGKRLVDISLSVIICIHIFSGSEVNGGCAF